LAQFEDALRARDIDRVVSLFGSECYWRDLVSFSWNIVTLEGREDVSAMLRFCLQSADPCRFYSVGHPVKSGEAIESWFSFETESGRGTGHVRLVDGKAWTLLTALDELKGFEEPLGERRVMGGTKHDRTRINRRDGRDTGTDGLEGNGTNRDPEVVIVGGGQGGIALAARLGHLGVPTVVVERNDRPGDSWRRRYKSLALHDPVWYDHFPYLQFPQSWPVYPSKDKIGDWLESYSRIMDIDYWCRSTARTARYDEETARWTLVVDRDGSEVTVHPRQLVFATGVSGKPNIPKFPGADLFQGQIQHSSQHSGPEGYEGKKVVVVGSNNSAHDICGALWEAGAEVTMVQRSPACVVRSASMRELALGPLYSERAVADGFDTRTADLTLASIPYRIMGGLQKPIYDAIRLQDAEYYRRLTESGFEVDFGEDESGLFMKYLRRGSGYYIDTGSSEMVADGRIGLAKGQVVEIARDAVILEDGTRLAADLIILATGYGSMNQGVADIIGQEMADRVGKVWGLGSGTAKDPGPWEGEERNMWKPTQQKGLWFHGGNLHQSRHYSLYLALQLKARYEGLSTPVYGLQPVFHRE